jgi:hypothetical protein
MLVRSGAVTSDFGGDPSVLVWIIRKGRARLDMIKGDLAEGNWKLARYPQ